MNRRSLCSVRPPQSPAASRSPFLRSSAVARPPAFPTAARHAVARACAARRTRARRTHRHCARCHHAHHRDAGCSPGVRSRVDETCRRSVAHRVGCACVLHLPTARSIGIMLTMLSCVRCAPHCCSAQFALCRPRPPPRRSRRPSASRPSSSSNGEDCTHMQSSGVELRIICVHMCVCNLLVD